MAYAHKRHGRDERDIGDIGTRWQDDASLDSQFAQRCDFLHGQTRPLQ